MLLLHSQVVSWLQNEDLNRLYVWKLHSCTANLGCCTPAFKWPWYQKYLTKGMWGVTAVWRIFDEQCTDRGEGVLGKVIIMTWLTDEHAFISVSLPSLSRWRKDIFKLIFLTCRFWFISSASTLTSPTSSRKSVRSQTTNTTLQITSPGHADLLKLLVQALVTFHLDSSALLTGLPAQNAAAHVDINQPMRSRVAPLFRSLADSNLWHCPTEWSVWLLLPT